MTAPIHAVGVSRVAENKRALEVVFNRRPTDDEMRTAHIILRDLDAESPRIEAMHADRSGYDISISGARRALNVLAASLAKTFEAERGVNYVEYALQAGKHDFVLTLQKRCMKTPHELREKAERERDEAVEALKGLRHHFICRCDDAYLSRNRHAPECKAHELADIDAAIAKATGGDR